MIAPDDGLEDALRQALSAAASQVEPGDGGLERILVRTGGTAPRSWLASMAAEGLRRARHWVWRGHWAWQDPGFWRTRYQVLQGPVADWRGRALGTRPSAWLAVARAGAASLATGSPAHDSLSLRSHGRLWARLAAGLAAAACITAVTVSDPPLRAALAQVSATVLTGGSGGLQPGVGGTGGGAASATGAHGTSASGSAGAQSGTLPPSARPGSGSSPAPCLTPSAVTGTLRATASPSATPSSIAPTSVPSAASAITPPTSCPTASGGATPQPTAPSTPTSAAPTTPAPTTAPATAPPTTAPPTTAPPTTAPPTDSATPTQTPSAASSAGTATGGSPSGTTPDPAP